MTDFFDLSKAKVMEDPDEEKFIHDVNTAAIQDAQEESLKKKQAADAAAGQVQKRKQPEQTEAKHKEGFMDQMWNMATNDGKPRDTSGATQIVKGVGDFLSDVAGLIPFGKGIDEWWDKSVPRSDNDLENAGRDAASIIVPTILGTPPVVKGADWATKSMNLSNRTKTLGRIAAGVGVDVGVTAVASTSERDQNVASALNKFLGWDIPWATREGDSPDVVRAKNVLEAAGMAGLSSLVEGFFALRKGSTVLKANDEVAAEALERRAVRDASGDDDITKAVEQRELMREQAVTEEALREMSVDLDGGYNPFINNIYEPQARGLNNVHIDPIQAKLDHFNIQNNIGTTNGRATSAVSDNYMYNLMQTARGSERGEYLEDLWLSMGASVDQRKATMKGDLTARAAEINRSIDNLSNAMNPEVPLSEFKKIVDEMRRDTFNSHKVLDEAGWVTVTRAFKQSFDKYWNPNLLRASAVVTQNAADNVADTIRAANLIGDVADTSRQQELIIKKLQVMAGEMRVRSSVLGSGLEFLKFKNAKKTPEEIAAWMASRDEAFENLMAEKAAKGAEFVDTYTRIAKENPEFLKPFYEIYDFTNGKVDDLQKLHRYMEDRIGVVGKAFVDGNVEVPSIVVQGAQAARYSNVLLGLAPVRAAAGNTIMLTNKPLSVLAGSALMNDQGTFKRALAGFGGVKENLQRAFSYMWDEYKKISTSPELINSRGRADSTFGQYDDFTAIESYVQSKFANSGKPGDLGRVAAWNLGKLFHAYNKNPIARLGVNALHALDGFTNSMLASLGARYKAYDELYSANNGFVDPKLFDAKQKELYAQAFDESGLVRDEAVRFAAKELTLNLDNDLVNGLEEVMKRIPAARALFMFPRTGLNAVEMAWSYNPLSSLGMAVGRVRQTFNARTPEQIAEVLQVHGIKATGEEAETAFKALKSEYVGRQLMGYSVVMGAGMMALTGNLHGNGPQDAAEKRRMIEAGVLKPLSFRGPDGQWRSYQGLEPFDSLLSIVADVVYQSSRVDQAVTEDWLRKIGFAISMNIANKTFLSGFEPLVGLISQDESAWARFFAMQADSMLPGTGIRSMLSKAVTPQLKDVENDFVSYMANRNKFLFKGNDYLKDLLDVYTAEPINVMDPMTASINAVLPFFKTNGGMEPWREWLGKTGWDNLQILRTNKVTQEPLSSDERQFVNNWIAQNSDLAGKIDSLRTANDGWWDKKIKEYAKKRGIKDQKLFPVKETVVYEMLDKIHNDAFNDAWAAWELENSRGSNIAGMKNEIKARLNAGDTEGANNTATQLQVLLQMRNR